MRTIAASWPARGAEMRRDEPRERLG